MKNEIKIYGLFEAVNDYNQCGSYLRYIWFKKPTLEEVSKAMEFDLSKCEDSIIVDIVNLFKGDDVRINEYGSHWKIKEIKEGQQPEDESWKKNY